MVYGLLTTQADLFNPPETGEGIGLEPWKPRALKHEEWPPPYERVYAWRIEVLAKLRTDPNMLAEAKAYYSTRPGAFICDWCDTYNPRRTTGKWMPFVLFWRQKEFVDFLEQLRHDGESGLVEKCRDIGATWLACAYSVWAMIFIEGDATGWGSRKENLVDKLGDTDSIFEKIRLLIQRLPDVFRPDQLKSAFMKLINEGNGASVTGEAGDNIGRGGRKSRYFVDEAAHIERPEKIEASLGDNTDVRIDMSSVNGLGNVFHRRREAGVTWTPDSHIAPGAIRVFVFDWRDHPEKTQEWYDLRKARAEREGMQHIFAQEVDRNYSAAVDNTVISYEWITAAVDAHFEIPCLRTEPPDNWMAALDVADEGVDRNALALRQWVILRDTQEWGERDPGVTTRRMIGSLRERNRRGLKVQYDSIGIGASVKSDFNRLLDEGAVSYDEFQLVPWNAGGGVVNPYERVIPDDDQSMLNRDFFQNMKAQAWWALRTRFYKTWRARTMGDTYEADELISLDSSNPLLHQLMKELAQPTRGQSASTLKMLINKTPPGTRSPNLADAVVMAFFPAPERGGQAEIGSYSG